MGKFRYTCEKDAKWQAMNHKSSPILKPSLMPVHFGQGSNVLRSKVEASVIALGSALWRQITAEWSLRGFVLVPIELPDTNCAIRI